MNGCTARKDTKIQNLNKEAKEEKQKRIVCGSVRDEAIEENGFCVRWKCHVLSRSACSALLFAFILFSETAVLLGRRAPLSASSGHCGLFFRGDLESSQLA